MQRLNPGQPIPPEATDVHGISDADVADCPSFAAVAPELLDFFTGCDLHGYNVRRFDMPMLAAELERCHLWLDVAGEGVAVIDSLQVYTMKQPRTLAAAYAHYVGGKPPGGGPWHGALTDALAVQQVLTQQLRVHRDLPRDVCGLQEYASRPSNPNWLVPDGKLAWRNRQVRPDRRTRPALFTARPSAGEGGGKAGTAADC